MRISNYLTVALRLFIRRKLYSTINVIGLGIAVAFSLLVLLFIHNERAFDKFHHDADRKYVLKVRLLDEAAYSRSETNPYFQWSVLSNGLGDALKNEVPETESVTQVKGSRGIVRIGVDAFEQSIHFVDESFFGVLSFPAKSGSIRNIFLQPNDLAISEVTAIKYFGNSNVTGQTLSLKVDGMAKEFIIKAVIEVPTTSSFQPEVLIGMSNYPYYENKSWSTFQYSTFIKLRPGVSEVSFKQHVDTLIAHNRSIRIDHVRKEYKVPLAMAVEDILLTPISDIHFDKDVRLSKASSDMRYSWILGGVALLIMLIASINYITFALASSVNRRKEIGIRKTIGASGFEIFRQFNIESFVLAFAAAFIGLFLAAVCLPLFNQLTEKSISFSDIPIGYLTMMILSLILLLSLLSGGYPAIYVARFKPAYVLRSKHIVRTTYMKPLVVMQFSLSAFLMISSLIMYRQMHYIATTDLGFNDKAVIALPTNLGWTEESDRAIERFREKVKGSKLIEGVSGTVDSFGKGTSAQTFSHKEQEIMVYMNKADEYYLSLLEIPLLHGRNFIAGHPADSNAVIINETLARKFELEDLTNDVLKPTGNSKDWLKVIGIMRDYHFASFAQEIEPLLLKGPSGDMHFMTLLVKLDGSNIPAALNELEHEWKSLYPDVPFKYSFIDEDIATQYENYDRWTTLAGAATTLAIVIAGLGLFGLSGMHAVNKTKEIGIRKTLGAGTSSLFVLLNRPFVSMAVLAFILATPVSWYLMNKWIENFKYHITLGWELFVISMVGGLLIALVSVSYHGLKTININPVESLKHE